MSAMHPEPRLSAAQQRLLLALAGGATLKVHRTLDGEKSYRLHSENRASEEIDPGVVDGLAAQALLVSNMKFPAATFLLTERGVQEAVRLGAPLRPLTPRQYG